METNNENLFSELEKNAKVIKTELKEHLQKFDNLDDFLLKSSFVVGYYFEKQNEFTTIDSFKEYLKVSLNKYVNYFLLSRDEKKEARKEIRKITEVFDELVYFGEYNPIKARRERLETGITMEEQDAEIKGRVLEFQKKAKEVVE